jgi:hypothetical protein
MLSIIEVLDQQKAYLEAELAKVKRLRQMALTGDPGPESTHAPAKKSTLSAEGRKRISEARRKYWAEKKRKQREAERAAKAAKK